MPVQTRFVRGIVAMTIWCLVVLIVAYTFDLMPMIMRFTVAYHQAKSDATIPGAYAALAGISAFSMVVAGTCEIELSRRYKNAVGPAFLGSLVVTAILSALHLIVALMCSPGPFYHFPVDVAQLTALPALGGLLYLAIRCTAFDMNDPTKDQLRQGLALIGNPRKALHVLRREARREGEPEALIHPKLRLPRGRETKHVLLVAAPGAGKTQVIAPLLQDVLARGEAAIIYDFKGDYTAAYGEMQGTVLLTPSTREALPGISRPILTVTSKWRSSLPASSPREMPRSPFFHVEHGTC